MNLAREIFFYWGVYVEYPIYKLRLLLHFSWSRFNNKSAGLSFDISLKYESLIMHVNPQVRGDSDKTSYAHDGGLIDRITSSRSFAIDCYRYWC